MSVCGSCDPCENACKSQCCNNACLRWGFDDCFLRGRCKDGTELDPLNLCEWLHTHETCTELKLVPQTTDDEANGGYMSYINECGEEYKFWVCDFLGLGNIECLHNVYDREPAQPCDLMVFSPDCGSDPTHPKHNKWSPYHIPDAGNCMIQPDADGYYHVLVKDDCGCIKECKLFAQSQTWEYALRDSWPDDPDWPFTHGGFTEVIDTQLDTKIPMFGVTDLEVTIQYAYGIQNHVYGTYRNFKSTVTPSGTNTTTPSLSDTYSKAIVLQGCNLSPWGSWEWQASRTFVVPKGKKLFLVNKVECRDINGVEQGSGDNTASSRLHALHVFVRATKGVQL